MYIEFQLPVIPSSGHGIPFVINCIELDIEHWAKQHDVKYYRTKRHKLTYRLVLKNDEAYTHFGITWNPIWAASKNFVIKNPK